MSNARNLANLLNSSGVLTADAGVKADNITIDGTEIDLSSGDLTLDVSGNIILDVDGGDVHFQDSGSSNRFISIKNSSGSCVISNPTADGDITFSGNDDGVGAVNALVLDMSEGGNASFNGTVTANAGVVVDNITIDGAEIDLSSGDLTIDSAGDIILDVDGGDVHFQDNGQSNRFVSIKNSSGSCLISNPFADGDITLQGNDAGVGAVNALTLDMSAGGEATFSNDVNVAFQRGYQIAGGTGNSKVRFTTTTGDGGANTVQVYWNATYGSNMAGGCLGAYNRSNVYSAPSASISGSSQFAIYGVIGVS